MTVATARRTGASTLFLVLVVVATLVVGCGALRTGAADADAPGARDGAASGFDTTGLERRDGLLTTWLDRDANRLLVELPAPRGEDRVCVELLAVAALSRGLGSNDVGLDRGLLGEERVLRVRRLGKLVRFEVPNTRYVVDSEEPAQQRAARESFAGGVLWGAEVAQLADDGRALVDLTPWLTSDLVGAARQLQSAGQGAFRLDAERSALELDDCLVFPENLELEATLGFRGDAPGAEVAATAADAFAPGLRQHVTLMALPAPGYEPRAHDPRAGSFSVSQVRLDAPLGEPTTRELAIRHRLVRGADGTPEPLTYYVDRGAPEPVRTALLEGARWWSDAFAAAGWPDTFRVELLPEGVHPLDSRYHVIQWVHRRTRGWSYGRSVVDPRTGEILKAHVTLGALRVRQDVLLFEGLLGARDTGRGGDADPVQLALARLRQLSAHEVGHTLGLAHNFAASTYHDRASVMDYPAPRVLVRDDESFDLSEAYGVGVGSWDHLAIRDLYGPDEPSTHFTTSRVELISTMRQFGNVYLSDADARPAGAADPRAALWDDGADAVAALRHALRVRRLALERFDATRAAPGRPRAHLQEVLVPVVLHHRYAVDRAAKLIGGREVDHVFAGERWPGIATVSAERQRAGLAVLLDVLDPDVLALPDQVRALLSPRVPGEEPHRELFPTASAPHVDPLSIAALLVDQVLDGVLRPERLERVAEQRTRDAAQLSVNELLQELCRRALAHADDEPDAAARALRRVVLERVAHALVVLRDDARASRTVRAQAEVWLTHIAEVLERDVVGALRSSDDREHVHHARALAADIRRELDRPRAERPREPEAPRAPPGSPIGAAFLDGRRGCDSDPAWAALDLGGR